MKIVAVVPIKNINKRLPGKNLKQLANRPLYHWILAELISVTNINEIYIFSSDFKFNKSMPPNDRIIELERHPRLNSDDTNFTDIMNEFISIIDADVYIYSHATSPYITRDIIYQCLYPILDNKSSSTFTATEERDFYWYDGKPLTYNPSDKLPRSQDLTPLIKETSGVYAFTKEFYLNFGTRVNNTSKPIIIDRVSSIDINDEFDFINAKNYENILIRRIVNI